MMSRELTRKRTREALIEKSYSQKEKRKVRKNFVEALFGIPGEVAKWDQ